MDTSKNSNPSELIARELRAGARSMGRFFATASKPDAVAGALVMLELLVPLLVDAEHHGLSVRQFNEIIVEIARGIRHAEEND